MSRALPDAEARRRILEDLDTTLFVEAAAGTGKTTALVGRIVALLRSGRATLDRVVALTFTDKAAGEMRLRLRSGIEETRLEAAHASEERTRLDHALEQLELARISTIHSFCADLLRERPIEAGVDPLFQVAPEEESQRLLERAFDDWFQRALADPPEGTRRLLRRRTRGRDTGGARETLLGAVRTLVEHRDFSARWRRDPFDRAAAIDAALVRLEALGDLAARAGQPDDWLTRNLANVARFVSENRLREEVRGRDHDALEAELRELGRNRRTGWHYKGRARKLFGPGIEREAVLAQRDAAAQSLHDLQDACDADLAACLQAELLPVVEGFEDFKRRAGMLDFVDLLIRARDLLASNVDVRRELCARTSHYFVDEFQDTDPLQAEILLLLASEDPSVSDWQQAVPAPGRLFVVGDPKQSIYRFRRADVAIYEQTKQRLAAHGARAIDLKASFRAVPSLQRAVNAAFEPLMQGAPDHSQARYVPLEPVRPECEGQPSLVVLPAPRPYGDYGTVVNWKIDDSLPDAVAAFVSWLVTDSGWTVAEGAGETGEARVPVRPRHVCLLFRRFKSFRDDVTRPYVRALEARGVPHVLVGGRSFHDREEVLALRNALCAIEWPEDELRVYATLRGPLFAFTDDVLLAYRSTPSSGESRRRLHPLAPRDESHAGELAEVADALAILAGLHAGRNRRPIADTVGRLLEAVRAHAAFAIWPTGEQALANCLRIIDLARRFERRGAPSFRAFVEHLENQAERGTAEDAPVVEEGTEGVRIMTAHKAKGLEFPVVVLCDPTCRASRDQPSRHVDPAQSLWAEPLAGCAPRELLEHRDEELARDGSEAIRLAYVAATRARDLLVVPGVADSELDDVWLAALNPVVYPTAASPGEGEPAPGCPGFGRDAIAHRPRNARRPPRNPVSPGLLRPRQGGHTAVWWDPNVLTLDVREQVGLRQQNILQADEDGSVAEQGVRDHDRWQAERNALRDAGTVPSHDVATITALAEERPDVEGVPVESVPGERAGRPHGKRFGTLVHAALAAVDLAASEAEVRRVTALQGRIVGASSEEVEAAGTALVSALRHPLLARAAASAALRRETPVQLCLDDGRLAEGVVDLAFREGEGSGARWTVVDFKTDVELGERRATYAAQVRLYADAIARATGEPASGLLLVV